MPMHLVSLHRRLRVDTFVTQVGLAVRAVVVHISSPFHQRYQATPEDTTVENAADASAPVPAGKFAFSNAEAFVVAFVTLNNFRFKAEQRNVFEGFPKFLKFSIDFSVGDKGLGVCGDGFLGRDGWMLVCHN